MTASESALVLFSGGQDSTACLAWALARFARVETLGFAYGQRHAAELECRKRILARLREEFPHWTARLGEDHELDLGFLKDIGGTAMTSEAEIAMGKNGLPTTFVPARNLMFVIAAASLAYRRDIAHLVGGMCETDYSGYPDCRAATLAALNGAINLGTERQFVVEAPLMKLDKAATWALAHELGGDKLVDLIVEETHSCYLGDRTQRHDWGYGCGACPACELRARGFQRWSSAR